MGRLVLLLLFTAVLGIGKGYISDDIERLTESTLNLEDFLPMPLQCYACSDCHSVSNSTPTRFCPKSSDDGSKQNCVTYVEKYKNLNRPWFTRGCASEIGTCEDIKRRHYDDQVQIITCNECEGNKCNSVGKLRSFPKFMAFCALIVTPIVTKYAIS